ncbi:MAG TPA: DUF2769 domain-containing protein [Methanobacterium sp.]|nr:DUF2769 domain-containing protein [Methanobacterium sp.]
MEIEFNRENIEKCLCSECKVQGKSQCVKDKNITLQEKALSYGLIEPEEFPGLYCANGKAKCLDLEGHEECLCAECPIYSENELLTGAPNRYFCLDGPSTRCEQRESTSEDIVKINDMLRDYYLRRD